MTNVLGYSTIEVYIIHYNEIYKINRNLQDVACSLSLSAYLYLVICTYG